MLSLLVIGAITGLCLAQDSSEFSECPKLNEITTKTCEHHLSYLKTLHSDSYNYFMEISQLKDPISLVQTVNIEKACNQSDHLSTYYKCVFTEVKSCLVNSSQKMAVPNPHKMADAIISICENQDEIDGTCYQSKKDAAAACSVRKMSEQRESFMPAPGKEVNNANLQAADDQGVAEVEGGEGTAEVVKDDPSAQSQGNQNAYMTYTQLLEKQREQVCGFYEVSIDCLDESMSMCRGYGPIVWELFVASAPEMCDFPRSAAPATLAAYLLLLLPVLCRWLQA